MKHIFTAPLIFLACAAGAQSNLFAVRDGLISYERVEQLDTMKADKIFTKTKEWVIETFNSSKTVIQGESKPSLIKCNYLTSYSAALGMKQKFTNALTLKIKDGAIKITIDNYATEGGGKLENTALKLDGTMRPSMKKSFQSMEDEGNRITESLLAFLKKKNDF
jgi:hypothetical protein